VSLPTGLSSYEFERALTPSRDLPYYHHLRITKEGHVPRITPDGKPRFTPLHLVEFFGSAAPLEIEIGCGKGGFLAGYCEKHPELPFLALEKEAEFAFMAAGRLVKRPQLKHARVVLGDAFYFLRDFLPDQCARAVHIYFPDPWPKKRHRKHRIIREDFLAQVRRVSLQGARLFFGTDHADYNADAREIFAHTPWLKMRDADAPPTEGIQTNFEIKYRKVGKPIYRCVLELS